MTKKIFFYFIFIFLISIFNIIHIKAAGNGLCADYYAGANFDTFYYDQIDPTVNFHWEPGVTPPGIPAGPFSIKWHGKIMPLVSGTYNFCTNADDGTRLWVDGIQLVDDWNDHGARSVCGTINLTAGQYYEILLEYYENGFGPADAQLLWSYPGNVTPTIIPQSQLYCSCLTTKKSVNTSVAAVGDTITYVLTTTNCGLDLTNVRIWDTIASNLQIVNMTPAPTYSSAPYYRWDFGNMTGGSVISITITARVTSGTNGQVVHNTATNVSDGNPPFVSNDAIFRIFTPGTELQKSANPTSLYPGDTVTYTITWFNPRPTPVPLKLNLRVASGGQYDGSSISYKFEITNYSGGSIDISHLSVGLWISDNIDPSLISHSNYYGGNTTPFAGWNGPPITASFISLNPPILTPSNRQASLKIEFKTTSHNSLPNNTAWNDIQEGLQVSWPVQFTNRNNYYSQNPGTAYVNDSHFVLYYDGVPVTEWLDANTPDPDTGCEPGYVVIYDTLPTQLDYIGSTGGGVVNNGILSWQLTCIPGGTTVNLQWWGRVKAGTPAGTIIPNRANYDYYSADGFLQGLSNYVNITVLGVLTPTRTPSSTSTRTSTPTWTRTYTPSVTYTPSRTPTPTWTPTPTPSRTLTPTYTRTLTPSPSPTPSRTPTPTFTRTPTPSPSSTPSRTPTPTYTRTPTQSRTPTLTNTRTPTPTFTNTVSPTPTYTSTPTPTNTNTRTSTPSYTNTVSPTPTYTRTPTPTNTRTPTSTSTFTYTLTRTPTFTYTDTISSNTPTATPTFTRTSTRTPTPTSTNTVSPTPTYTQTPTPTNTRSSTPSTTASPSDTRTPTLLPSLTNTRAATPSFTQTATNSQQPTITDTISSNTPTVTPTYTNTRTVTPTWTDTSSPTSTYTQTSTPTDTNTRTPTPSPTHTRTITFTLTFTDTISSNTPTVTPTYTNTRTVTLTWTNTFTSTSTRTSTSTLTMTLTATDTSMNTATNTPTVTRTWTNTRTSTITLTGTPTATITLTSTETVTQTNTMTFTPTPTYTATFTLTATVTITPDIHSALLDITLTSDGENAQAGAIIEYKIIIENKDSSINAYNIRVWDTLPPEVEFVDNDFIVKPIIENGVVIWQIPKDMELKPGEKLIIEFKVKISKTDGIGLITNTVSADYQDEYYNDTFGNGRHPVITSNINEYPEEPIIAYPNPYKISEKSKVIKFVNLPPNCTVQIYTISGEGVISLNTLAGSRVVWDGKNRNGREVSTGIYYYVVLNKYSKQVVKGKIFIIK
jgi:uncharacterized repeat protein (TIGR01451 family)